MNRKEIINIFKKLKTGDIVTVNVNEKLFSLIGEESNKTINITGRIYIEKFHDENIYWLFHNKASHHDDDFDDEADTFGYKYGFFLGSLISKEDNEGSINRMLYSIKYHENNKYL